MSGRARQINSSINFLCIDSEETEIRLNVEAMENYKDLLVANDHLMKITPQIIKHSCTYTDEEIFVIDQTGARVSIDGSKDSLNMLIQKMSSKRFKVGKLSKFFEEDRQATMHYK